MEAQVSATTCARSGCVRSSGAGADFEIVAGPRRMQGDAWGRAW